MVLFTHMSILAIQIINGILLVFNVIVNIVFTFCLIFPTEAGQRKQPLKLLLCFLICCSLSYCVSLSIRGIYDLFNGFMSAWVFILSVITDYSVDCSMVSFVWLNFYYFIQIVPAPFALFHWVKRNIKSTICVILGIDILITMLSRIVLYVFLVKTVSTPHYPSNDTEWQSLEQTYTFCYYMIMGHYVVLSCVTVITGLSTVCYLHRHLKNMRKMGTSISATRLRGQMRVTITGVFQGVFFFLYAIFLLSDGFTADMSKKILENNIKYTLTTCFLSGTTVTLGIGQNVFRKRIVNVYNALKRMSI